MNMQFDFHDFAMLKILTLNLIILISLQRLAEIQTSKSNYTELLKNGGFEVGQNHYPIMVSFHTLWILVCGILVITTDIEPNRMVLSLGIFLFILGQILRLLARSTLKNRWTTRVVIMPTQPLISHGVYKFLRHPNYVGVTFEIFSLPLICGSLLWAVVLSLLHCVVLFLRLSVENHYLQARNQVR